jgi:hypothetical protein
MSTSTILQLPQAVALTGQEQLEAVQSGTSVRLTAAQIAGIGGPTGPIGPTGPTGTMGTTGPTGPMNIPQNHQPGNYTLQLSDEGGGIFHDLGDGAATWTIPANASVAFPIGSAVNFENLDTNAVSIAINSDTMYLVGGAGATGTRTLAQYGMATALKVKATTWMINGVGLT